MKRAKIGLWTSMLALLLCTAPHWGWATRIVAGSVTGEVTATPTAHEIEVAHRLYLIKAGTPAAQQSSKFQTGDNVDLVLDAPAASANAEVIAISAHSGS